MLNVIKTETFCTKWRLIINFGLWRKSVYYFVSLCIDVQFEKKPLNPLNAELNSTCHLLILLGDLKFMGPCIVSISNKMQRYTVYLYLETALHFGWYFHPSSGAHTTLSTASGICHTVTAICHFRGRVGTALSDFYSYMKFWVVHQP
jgi:hypothetical protein